MQLAAVRLGSPAAQAAPCLPARLAANRRPAVEVQGGRVRRRSPYRHICADAGLALRRAGSAVRRDGTAGAAAGLPSLLHSLSSMARRVLPQRGSRTAAAGKSTGSQ